MKKSRLSVLVSIGYLATLALSGCGSDDDDLAVCEEAFDAWCACPNVSCNGRPASCTGPDRTWAECINAAQDPCAANC